MENYHNSYNLGKEGLIDDDPQSQKINVINSHINDVKNNMKENVKNMMNNMTDMSGIESKSVSIKDTSFNFQKDAKDLENKMKRIRWRNRIILGVVVLTIVGLIVYGLVK